MKWIGQNIYDLISRFRNDVYLEDISTGTIASGGNLGLDSNNKIVKATVSSGSGDITSVTITTDSGGGSKAEDDSGSADFSILGSSGVGVTNSGTTITAVAVPGEIDHDSLLNFDSNEHFTQANITTVGTISTGVWQGTAIASAYLDSDTAHLSGSTFTGAVTFQNSVFVESADSTKPFIQIKNTNSNATGSVLNFVKDKGAAGADSDDISTILFTSDNSEQEQTSFASINAEVGTAADTDEAGKLSFKIAASNGSTSNLRETIVLTGSGANDIVNVGIGYGATSTTTIAGDLDIDGDTITTAGNIELATGGSGNITLDSAGDIALECGGGDLTCDADTVTFSSSSADDPKLVLQNNTNDNQGARFQIKKSRVTGGGAQGNNDNIAEIDFFGEDNAENQAQYAKILVKTNEVTNGQESGDMRFQVAAHDASLTQGLKLVGGSADGEVDVTIASGTSSVTTVAGTLTMGSTATLDNSGNLLTNAATATNLVASTSTAVQLGTVELGHASDTTIARSGSGTVTIEGKQIVTQATEKWIKNVCYIATQGTNETFIPLAGSAENVQVANGNVAMVMPTDGKLLKVHLKTQRDHSGVTTTVKMYNWDADEAHGNTTDTLLGSQSATGPASAAVGVFDFQSSLDSGTNVFTAGEMLAFSITNSSAVSSSCKYFVTLVFELDWSSY